MKLFASCQTLSGGNGNRCARSDCLKSIYLIWGAGLLKPERVKRFDASSQSDSRRRRHLAMSSQQNGSAVPYGFAYSPNGVFRAT